MNSVEAPWRRNFNFAQEVFHLLTWTSIPPERMIEDPAFRDRIESLANAFASSLLLPGDAVSIAIERHLKDGKIYRADLVENAREFDVSTVALLYRLLNLGYFDREAVERLLNDPTAVKKTLSPAKGCPGVICNELVAILLPGSMLPMAIA
ncbi:ImmA/IrrE family metallo-endopeptidase [Dehalococcoidia bacterium]|nr:ImmA/IrrE family metallo-endopeptidase [Dehalococcoidia bacterium]